MLKLTWIVVILAAVGFERSQAATITELPSLSNDSITCYPDPEFFVSNQFLMEAGITAVDKVILANNTEQTSATTECTAVQSSTGYTFLLNQTFGDCAADLTIVDGTVRKVTYYILVIPVGGGVISREGCVFIRVCCNYGTVIEGQLSPLNPENKLHDTFVAPALVEYHAEGQFYSNSALDALFTGGQVLVDADVYVNIWLVEIINSPNIQMERCFATQTSDPNVGPRYYIIDGRCASSDSQIVSVGFSRHFTFKFRSFHWLRVTPANQRIYIQCEMLMCGERLNKTCETNVCSRRRREIPADNTGENTQLVTVGPLQVVDPKANDVTEHIVFEPEPVKCDKVSAGCAHDCAVDNDGGIVCTCPSLQMLLPDGKTCMSVEEILFSQDKKSDMLSHAPIIVLIAFGVTCIFLLLVKIQNYI